MPFSLSLNIARTRLLVWKIEPEEHFDFEETIVLPKSCKRRKQERLAEWALVRMAFGENAQLEHYSNEAPYVVGFQGFVSISHSHQYVVLAINSFVPIGVDIELKGERVLRIVNHFAQSKEFISLQDEQQKIQYFSLLWSAKESIFKSFGTSIINRMTDYAISPFDFCAEKGEMQATIFRCGYAYSERVYFMQNSEYVITVAELA